MPRGKNLRVQGMLRGIFDKETRRKAVAVVGAAMELRARLGEGRAAKSAVTRVGIGCSGRWPPAEGPVLRSASALKSVIELRFLLSDADRRRRGRARF
jgi:hypothetical protein